MPIDSLMTFNRLKQLSTDKQTIVDAIKTSDQLTVYIYSDSERIVE